MLQITCRQTVACTVQRYLETGSTVDRERTGRPNILAREHYVTVDDMDCETTTSRLTEMLLQQFPGLKVSERTVARGRQELGWVHQTAKYCQLFREANKVKWLEWVQKRMSSLRMLSSLMNLPSRWNTMLTPNHLTCT